MHFQILNVKKEQIYTFVDRFVNKIINSNICLQICQQICNFLKCFDQFVKLLYF